MLQRGIRLGKVLGIEIGLDYSWFLIFALVTYTLSQTFWEFYPAWASQYPVWGGSVYWVVAAITSLLFFSSVLAHEMGHSVVAIRTGLPVQSITLFLFGGVARIIREPSSPWQEFLIAIAGPLVSLALGGLFWLLSITAVPESPIQALADNLSYINIALAVFNMIPGFPLDGGRVLRAILWKAMKDVFKATHIASWVGRGVGMLLIAGGITLILMMPEYLISGLWFSLIGWFLHNTALATQQQAVQRKLLSRFRVRDLVHDELPQVTPDIILSELVSEVFLKRGRHSIRVVRDGQMIGLVTLPSVRRVPRAAWETTCAHEVMTPIHSMSQVDMEAPLLTLYDRMSGTGVGQFAVVENGEIKGIVTQGQLLDFLRMNGELGMR